MKDFGIKIDDVKLDRFTQDSRLIKMKIWLHFTKLFQDRQLMKKHEDVDSEEEDEESSKSTNEKQSKIPYTTKPPKESYNFKVHPIHQVLDVCLSIYTQPSI